MKDSTCCFGLSLLVGCITVTVIAVGKASESDTWESLAIGFFLATFLILFCLLAARYGYDEPVDKLWFSDAQEFRESLEAQKKEKEAKRKVEDEKAKKRIAASSARTVAEIIEEERAFIEEKSTQDELSEETEEETEEEFEEETEEELEEEVTEQERIMDVV